MQLKAIEGAAGLTYDHTCTFGCILSPSFTNSALPLPAVARPLTSAVEAPEPIPNVNTLQYAQIRTTGKINLHL